MKKINIVFVLLFIIFGSAKLSAQTFSNTNSYSIPSYDPYFGVYSDIIIPSVNSTAAIINVTININHPCVSDLDIYLVNPLGNEILLSQHNGGSGQNYTNTVFTMSASTSITMGTAPFTGSYLPQESLTSFFVNPNGTWRLHVFDDVSGNAGTIQNWSITFVAPPCPTVGIHTYPISGINTMTCRDSLFLEPNDSVVAVGTDYPTLIFQFITHANGASNAVTIYEDGNIIYQKNYGQIAANIELTVWDQGPGLSPSSNYTIQVCDNNGGFAPMEWRVYDGNGVNYASGATPFTGGCTTFGPWHPYGSATWTISPPVPGLNYSDWGGAYLNGNEAGPGTYTLTYHWDNQAGIQGLGGYPCSGEASTIITITNPWNASWSSPGTICSIGGTLNLNNYITGNTGGTWSGTGVSGSNFDPSGLSGPVSITYSVGNSAACNASVTHTITVNPLPIADAGPDVAICNGSSTTLNASGGTNYSWSPSGGLSSTSISNPIASPVTTTTYTVTASSGPGCTAIDNVTVTVNSLPTADAGSDVLICGGYETQLSASGGITYSWSPQEGLSATDISNPVANPAITTTYIVTVTDGNGCTDTDDITINALAAPVANAGIDQMICLGESATLSAIGGGSYLWNTGDTTAIISYTPSVTTVYTVTASYTNGCTSSDDVVVTVNSIPTVSLTSDPEIFAYQGQIITYTAIPAGYDNYDFYVNNNLVQSGSSNIYQTNTLQDNQVVLVVVNKTGCVGDPDSLGMHVKPIPNAFTPHNVDGKNDIFVKGLNLTIFNRWGQKLYEGTEGWNGKYNGNRVSSGTYYYVIKLSDLKNVVTEIKGPVTLISNNKWE